MCFRDQALFWALFVIIFSRLLLWVAGAASLWSIPLALKGAAPLQPELAAFLAAQPKWTSSVSAQAAYGYKDNLLLSAAGEERSALARGSVEVFLLRMAGSRFDYSFYAQAEGTRYFKGDAVDQDATAWLMTEAGVHFTDTLKLSLPLTGYFFDQVFDASETELRRDVAALKVSGLMVAPTLRWDFLANTWLEAQVGGERKLYQDRVNDSTIGDATLRLGSKLGQRVEVRISASERRRKFDERAQYSLAGRELVGTELKVREREGELRLDWTIDQDGKWKSTTRLGWLRYADNGSGYFDYSQKRIVQELDWTTGDWLLRLSGTAGRIDFNVQTVGVGVDLPFRLSDDYAAELKVERKLSERWTALAAYTWERRRSNDPISSYRMNEGLLGARWSWER